MVGPMTQLALVVTDTNTTACPAGLTRIPALPGWDGDLNSGAHQPPAWTAQCGGALDAACSATKLPGANESCIDCLTANSASLLGANCTQDSAVAWCASTFTGSIAFLCAGSSPTAGQPIIDLVAFSTPSDADPDGDCPHGARANTFDLRVLTSFLSCCANVVVAVRVLM